MYGEPTRKGLVPGMGRDSEGGRGSVMGRRGEGRGGL